ncbi:hypothetical protein [Arundinibacter roseus]|uniref:Uncharacterized protein n=1 Tax=Arundinibacter roseus TaxID=2070510 RepID=A0A4V2XA31_9BACT|nr:hypothetical protein [Arundinibacter roseus]TDB66065.1 hypothetical protein EZE20_09925 [Arundinibacter roseus]
MEFLEKALLLKKELDTLRPLSKEQELRIMLGPTNYFILLAQNNDAVLEKRYDVQLTEQEINELVGAEMKRHTEVVKNKITNNKKTG